MSVNSIQGNLCKGLRACGISKELTYQLLNIVEKWIRCNGVEWTNDRIKALRQWYETCLTGHPEPPKWLKHSKTGYPLGVWGKVFRLPKAKALGILSLNTVFYEDQLSAKQKEKFLHGLAGNGSQDPDKLRQLMESIRRMRLRLPSKMPEIRFPTVFDMTGSIPVHDGRSSVRPQENLGEALKALQLSWESVPQVTVDFLQSQDLLDYMPMEVLGNQYQLELDRPHDTCIGKVSVLQQAQLKARIVGNPNRVTQVTLDPLKAIYMTAARNLPTDVTHDQESGVMWVQEQLRQGLELAGSDLTSASDLLDVRLCLDLIDATFGFRGIAGYQEFTNYYLQVCRAPWYCPSLHREVKWEQGDVLGTGPSFGLLTLSNNAAALLAYWLAKESGSLQGTNWYQCFRVVGDDIVMRSEMEQYYSEIIESLGGEINHSKTLKSDRVAEFAGRVITSDSSYLKAIKYSEPSDSSFMSYVAQLGDQAKYFLLPKQRKVYDLLKTVPGVVVPGPWMQDSYGIPLSSRYAWYLDEVEPALRSVEPDLPLADYDMVLLKAQLSQDEAGQSKEGYDQPFFEDGYLPSQVTPTFKVGGDPRLTEGKTTLDVLYPHVAEKDITPFEEWKIQNPPLAPHGAGHGVSSNVDTSTEKAPLQVRFSLQGARSRLRQDQPSEEIDVQIDNLEPDSTSEYDEGDYDDR